MDTINYLDDEIITEKLLKEFTEYEEAKLEFASGYFNPTDNLSEILWNSKSKIEILTASPQANGFYWGGKVKSHIPKFYWKLEYDFLKNQNGQSSILEYAKPNWTFHAKGMWFSENENQKPFMTVVGSSNYSMRSYKRDSECNFFIYSECEDFRSKMKEEVDYLFSNATKVNLDIIRKDKEMKLELVKRFAANRLRSFLYSSIPSRRALEASFSSSNFTSFD